MAQHYIEKEDFSKAYEQIKEASKLAPRNIERNKRLWDLARLNRDKVGQFDAVRKMAKFAKNSIHDSPEDMGVGNRSVNGGFIDYAYYCGKALALSHARGDRRSAEFEKAIMKILPFQQGTLKESAFAYAEQVKLDHRWLVNSFSE